MADPQTSVVLDPAVGMPGLLADSGIEYAITRINKLIARVVTVTIASVNNTTDYENFINGVNCSYTSAGSASEAGINAGMLAAINDSTFNGPGLAFDVTAVQGATTATIIVTADVAGTAFTLTTTATILTYASTTENGGDIPFGFGVAQGSTATLARLPTASGDTYLGITVLDQTQEVQADDTHEYTAGSAMAILRQGRIWVNVEDAVTAGGDVYVRYAASANGDQLGAIRSDGDSSSAAQLTGAVFATTQATPGGLAIVEINKP